MTFVNAIPGTEDLPSPSMQSVTLIFTREVVGDGSLDNPNRYIYKAFTSEGFPVYCVDQWPFDTHEREQGSDTRSLASAV